MTGAVVRCDCYCDRCDLLVGLDGLHVLAVEGGDGGLTVTVESASRRGGCRACGTVAASHGRRRVTLVDAPCSARPVRVVWLKRTWRCGEADCPAGVSTETHPEFAGRRALLTVRACWWAIRQLRCPRFLNLPTLDH